MKCIQLTLISSTCMMWRLVIVCMCVCVCDEGVVPTPGIWSVMKHSRELPEECIQHQAVKWSSGKAISTHRDLLLSLPPKLPASKAVFYQDKRYVVILRQWACLNGHLHTLRMHARYTKCWIKTLRGSFSEPIIHYKTWSLYSIPHIINEDE